MAYPVLMQSPAYFSIDKMLSSMFTHVTMSLHTKPAMKQSYHQLMDRICEDLVMRPQFNLPSKEDHLVDLRRREQRNLMGQQVGKLASQSNARPVIS